MMKRCIIALIAAAFIAPLYSQDKGAAKDEKKAAEKTAATEKKPAGEKEKVTVYQDIALEDFETTPYTDKNMTVSATGTQEARLTIRDQFPAPGTAKKYLGIKIKTRGGDFILIKPPKDIIIDKYCRSISMWVYGKKTYGEVSIMLQDTRLNNHKIVMVPAVDFLGWKKVTYNVPKTIIQEDDFLNQRKIMKLLNIQYRTVGMKQKPAQWEYLYIDDITATVRERYDDRQSDEW